MSRIVQDLYQFSNYAQPINLSFHQYLLTTEIPLLIHTGNECQTKAFLPELQEILKGQSIKYVFISHFEADECGGLSWLLKNYPDAISVCSEVTARQLSGFGVTNNVQVKKPGERLSTAQYQLDFIAYPSEMHLWDGLLLFEQPRQIFFSSDLMLGFGEAAGKVAESD